MSQFGEFLYEKYRGEEVVKEIKERQRDRRIMVIIHWQRAHLGLSYSMFTPINALPFNLLLSNTVRTTINAG